MLLRSDSNKLNVVFGVQCLNGTLCLGGELSDQRSILDRVILGHGAANGDTLRIHHNDALNSLVSVDTIDGFLDFLRL